MKSGNIGPDTLRDVRAERKRQDRQWGGTDHDDRHEPKDWLKFIEHQVEKGNEEVKREGNDGADGDGAFELRDRLVKIAAIALAGVDSIDRKEEDR